MAITTVVQPPAEVDTTSLAFIRQKYAQEAEKRVRPEGSKQFVALTHAEEARLRFLSQDPWVDHEALNARPSPVTNGGTYKFVIVGAGFGGLQFAVKLIESHLATPEEIRFVDAAGGFGGTWYWNRYPGLHCDLESYIYMPLLEETGYIPRHKYAKGAEVREHAERIAKQWKLTDSVVFRAHVQKLQWEEEHSLWKIDCAQGRGDELDPLQQRINAQYVYIAGGGLTHPQVPKLPGLSSFAGDMFHTARWNYHVSGGSQDDQSLTGFQDKRVAVIGTAATAIGVIPEIAKHAKELFVVQRTPAYVKPRNQYATDPDTFYSKVASKPGWQWERQLNWNSFITNSAKPGEEDLTSDGWTDMPAYSALLGSPSHGLVDPQPESLNKIAGEFHALDLPHMNAVRARIDAIVNDKATAEKLKPWYNTFCKRPTFSDEYLHLFNQPNVHLVDTEGQGPSEVTKDGLIVGTEEVKVDVIVFSTGYQTTGPRGGSPGGRLNIDIIGRNGLSMDGKWKSDGAATLHGFATHDFPNLFFTGASQGTATGNNVLMLAIIADNVAHVLSEAFRKSEPNQRPIINVTKEGEEAHSAEVAKRAPSFALLRQCTPGYFNGHGDGKNVLDEAGRAKASRGAIWSEGTQSFIEYVRKWKERGYLEGVEVQHVPA
ncbi:FAD/NAD(P)-binding domain-containing protein [Sarocladium strictum]